MSFLATVALPVAGLMALAIALPWLWALILPEGIAGLALNALLSVAVIALAVSGWAIIWYAGRGVSLSWGWLALWVAKTALAWAPMLVLGLAAQPRRWKEATW